MVVVRVFTLFIVLESLCLPREVTTVTPGGGKGDLVESSCVIYLKYYFGALYFQNAGGSCVKSSAQGSSRALVQTNQIL
jgi:hypothetical protein